MNLNLSLVFFVLICAISFKATNLVELVVPSSSDPLKCILKQRVSNILITNAITNEAIIGDDMIPVNGVLNFACYSGYNLKGYNQTRCNRDGTWTSKFPICFKHCTDEHPKSGFSTIASFQYNGQDVTSLREFEPNTIATITCANGYYEDLHFRRILTCTENGWFPYKQPCYMYCGKSSSSIQEFSYDGIPVNVTQVPWHVGIYNWTGSAYKNLCGGTIISPRLVVSAAQCFFDSQKSSTNLIVDPSTFKIAAGKFYKGYDGEELLPHLVQKQKISKIWIHPYYIGKDNGFYRDISIITLSEFFVFSGMVRPICLDFPQEHLQMIPTDVKGYIPIFSQHSIRNRRPSLRRLGMTTLSYDECESKLKNSSVNNLPGDKFCLASYDDNNACRGDSGSGFVVHSTVPDQYFLRGIISFSPSRTMDCGVNSLQVLTNTLYYGEALKDHWREDIRNDIVF